MTDVHFHLLTHNAGKALLQCVDGCLELFLHNTGIFAGKAIEVEFGADIVTETEFWTVAEIAEYLQIQENS